MQASVEFSRHHSYKFHGVNELCFSLIPRFGVNNAVYVMLLLVGLCSDSDVSIKIIKN